MVTGRRIYLGRIKDGECMITTEHYGLQKPESNEYVSIDVINQNMDAIDKELKNGADHADSKNNPHGVTAEQIGAAPAGHTHTASEVGAAPSEHTHGASDINSGTLPVSRGGTGRVSLADGQVLVGASANAINTRAITDNTSAAMCSGTYIPTCNTVAQHVAAVLNRNNCVHNAGTAYTTYMARGIALVTSAPSSLANGCCAFVYQ